MAQNGGGESKAPPGGSTSSPAASTPSSDFVGEQLAQTLRDLARGERAASALETNLTNLENKLDAILASLGETAGEQDEGKEEEVEEEEEEEEVAGPEPNGTHAAAVGQSEEKAEKAADGEA